MHFLETTSNFSRFAINSKNNSFTIYISMVTSAFHILQCFSNTNTNNIYI